MSLRLRRRAGPGVVWKAPLLIAGDNSASQLPLLVAGAAFFGLINTGVGVTIHQALLWLVRSARRSHVRAD